MWWLLIELFHPGNIQDGDLAAFHSDEPFLNELGQATVERELLYAEIVSKFLSCAVQRDHLAVLLPGFLDQIVHDALFGGQHGELIDLGLQLRDNAGKDDDEIVEHQRTGVDELLKIAYREAKDAGIVVGLHRDGHDMRGREEQRGRDHVALLHGCDAHGLARMIHHITLHTSLQHDRRIEMIHAGKRVDLILAHVHYLVIHMDKQMADLLSGESCKKVTSCQEGK